MQTLSPLESEVNRIQERLLESAAAQILSALGQSVISSVRRTQFILLTFFSATAIGLALLGYLVYRTSTDVRMHSVPVQATVKNIAEQRSLYSFFEPYHVYYGYKVNGKSYTGTGYSPILVLPGERLTINYMQGDVEKSFVPGTQDITTMALTFGGAAICLLLACRAAVRLKRAVLSDRLSGNATSPTKRQYWTNHPAANLVVAHTDVMPVRATALRASRQRKAPAPAQPQT